MPFFHISSLMQIKNNTTIETISIIKTVISNIFNSIEGINKDVYMVNV